MNTGSNVNVSPIVICVMIPWFNEEVEP